MCYHQAVTKSEAYVAPLQTTKMKFFGKTFNGFNPITIYGKDSILDV